MQIKIYQKMAEEKKQKLIVIHEVLPPEMMTKIFNFLDFKNICVIRQTCYKWKEIIDRQKILEKALCKSIYLLMIIVILLG